MALLAVMPGPLLCAHPQPDALLGPRLLLVQKDGRMALFLPETHIGTPAQNDAYFRTVIRPTFDASSVLLTERSIAPWFERGYDAAACPDEGAAESALDGDLTAAVNRHPPATLAILRAGMTADIGTLGRFIRFDRLFVDVHMRAIGQAPLPAGAGSRRIRVRNAQSGVLMAGAPRPAASVENTGTMLRAYCSLPPAQRVVLIRGTIALSDALSDAQPGTAHISVPDAALRADSYRGIDAEYRQVLSCMRAGLRHGSLQARDCGAGDGQQRTEPDLTVNRFMIVARGQAWVDGLAAVMQRERLPFYALGAAHFPDGPAGPGLITMMREAGNQVSLLDDRHALEAALARLPAVAPPAPNAKSDMHTLAGGCRRDGAVYGCEWHDAAVSFMIFNPQAADGQEIWSACFDVARIHGPQKYCTSGIRAVPSQP